MRLNAGFHDPQNGDSRQDFYPKSPSLRPAGGPPWGSKHFANWRSSERRTEKNIFRTLPSRDGSRHLSISTNVNHHFSKIFCCFQNKICIFAGVNKNGTAYVTKRRKDIRIKKRLLLVLASENLQIRRSTKSKSETLTPMAWAFTHIRCIGFCRYLRSVDKVISPRFLFRLLPTCLGLNLFTQKTIIIWKKLYSYLFFWWPSPCRLKQ